MRSTYAHGSVANRQKRLLYNCSHLTAGGYNGVNGIDNLRMTCQFFALHLPFSLAWRFSITIDFDSLVGLMFVAWDFA